MMPKIHHWNIFKNVYSALLVLPFEQVGGLLSNDSVLALTATVQSPSLPAARQNSTGGTVACILISWEGPPSLTVKDFLLVTCQS